MDRHPNDFKKVEDKEILMRIPVDARDNVLQMDLKKYGINKLITMTEMVESDDLVILGSRRDAQIRAMEANASCLIIGCGFTVDEEVISMAKKKDCVIITTTFDTFSITA